MGTRDPRVDVYIENSADFAPILKRIRSVVHEACPDVEETLKWKVPTFMYHGILCGMAAFKSHCVLGFWKGTLIVDRNGRRVDEAMGQFGRMTKLSDLPPRKTLAGYVKKAMRLNREGIKAKPKHPPKPKAAMTVPRDLAAALRGNSRAKATFAGFSRSHRNEYIEWITEAKRPETRARRVETAIEWLASGKPRNWKYMKAAPARPAGGR